MYHHLCDFFNLYASLHMNSSHPSAFSTDVHVIIWETYPYHSAFGDMWKAFTSNPLLTLNDFAGKTVCFRNVVFPLLPRMIFGLYYNTPLVLVVYFVLFNFSCTFINELKNICCRFMAVKKADCLKLSRNLFCIGCKYQSVREIPRKLG